MKLWLETLRPDSQNGDFVSLDGKDKNQLKELISDEDIQIEPSI